MIEKRSADNGCRGSDTARELDVFGAWRGISTRMVVDQHESARCSSQRKADRVRCPNPHAMQPASRYAADGT